MGWGNVLAIFGTIVAGFTAVVVLIVNAIRGSSPQEYHRRQTCMCPSCRKARYKAMKKQGHQVIGIRPDGSVVWSDEEPMEGEGDGWISTAELERMMVVSFQGTDYRITETRVTINGYSIALRNLTTHVEFAMAVSFDNARRKYWYVINRPGPTNQSWKW